jgi:hypothetical protein
MEGGGRAHHGISSILDSRTFLHLVARSQEKLADGNLQWKTGAANNCSRKSRLNFRGCLGIDIRSFPREVCPMADLGLEKS